MAHVHADRVQETSVTTGSGTLTLAGAVAGFRTFASGIGANNTAFYFLEAVDSDGVPTGDWEVGLGTVGAGGTTLARTTVLDSSNGGSAVSLAAGTKRVAVTWTPLGYLSAARLYAARTDGVYWNNRSGGGTLMTLSMAGSNYFEFDTDYGLNMSGNKGVLFGATVAALGNTDCGFLRGAPGVVRLNGGDGTLTSRATLASAPLAPPQITSDQNNYAPGVAMYYRLSADAPRSITGLSAGQVDGQECEFCNVGSETITLVNESGLSSAANRFLTTTGSSIELDPNEIAQLRWFSAEQSSTGRWRVKK